MRIWLDDLRAAPPGWTHARTVAEAEDLFLHNQVEDASFDHDLGHVDGCSGCASKSENPKDHQELPNGKHMVIWLIENGIWPKNKPNVHSANPVGRESMKGLIDRYGPYES